MTQLTDSRFNMWRAIVALAHADNKVVAEEKAMILKYLANVPFSDGQKKILLADMEDAQNIADRFNEITAPEDQGEFFEFARMMLWSDGDYDAQEEKLFSYLTDTQMWRVGKDKMQRLVRETRESARLERLAEDAKFEEEAEDIAGLGSFVRYWTQRS